ncbi:MAG: S-layer homology domain-containing protein, partial [Oscillospiraceae bacterium]|nr:S-layer homology domain-containing protein [Oscillospiraceae bacterium]
GVADRLFDPDGILTREQFATILYRYATLKGYDTASSVELGSYPDSGKISTWALDAMKWANAMMLVTGTTDANGNTILDPQGYAQRCQAAAVLHRFSVNVIPVEEPSTDEETTEDTTTDTETAE